MRVFNFGRSHFGFINGVDDNKKKNFVRIWTKNSLIVQVSEYRKKVSAKTVDVVLSGFVGWTWTVGLRHSAK